MWGEHEVVTEEMDSQVQQWALRSSQNLMYSLLAVGRAPNALLVSDSDAVCMQVASPQVKKGLERVWTRGDRKMALERWTNPCRGLDLATGTGYNLQ